MQTASKRLVNAKSGAYHAKVNKRGAAEGDKVRGVSGCLYVERYCLFALRA